MSSNEATKYKFLIRHFKNSAPNVPPGCTGIEMHTTLEEATAFIRNNCSRLSETDEMEAIGSLTSWHYTGNLSFNLHEVMDWYDNIIVETWIEDHKAEYPDEDSAYSAYRWRLKEFNEASIETWRRFIDEVAGEIRHLDDDLFSQVNFENILEHHFPELLANAHE